MQAIRFSDGNEYGLLSAVVEKQTLRSYCREVIRLGIQSMSYSQATSYFVDGAAWTIIDENGEEFGWSDYGVAGPVTDNRDGSVSVVMGKNNTAEQDWQDEVTKASQDTITLAGKTVTTPAEVTSLRAAFEQAAAKLSDSDALIAPSLSARWDLNQEISQGERRYYVPNDTLYKALISHKTSFANSPVASSEYWSEV